MDVYCWYNIGSKFVQLSILLIFITACIFGVQMNTKITTPSDMESMVYEEDPVSPMLVYYTMLRSVGKEAHFEVRDKGLHLISDDGIYSLYVDRHMNDGFICDPYTLYQFSDLYMDLPYTPELILNMFGPRIRDEDLFLTYLDTISNMDNFRDRIDKLVDLIDHAKDEYNSLSSLMLKIIGKIKVINIANQIFDKFTCTE